MTAYTRKLHKTDPAKAVAIHRLRYGKHTTLLAFTLAENEASELVRGGRVEAKIEESFDVTERLQRWSDRGWK